MSPPRMLLLLLLSSAACDQGDRLPMTTLTLGGQHIRVEVADEPHELAQGLQFRKKLPANEGMLFVYAESAPRSFWMEYTTIPLSIAFLDGDGAIVHMADMKPLDRTSVPSVKPARYALEMNKGWFAAHGIEAGARIGGLPDGPVQ